MTDEPAPVAPGGAAPPLDLAALRRRLAAQGGRELWRSLEAVAETPEFRELVEREFPRQASALGAVDRRQFLKLMGASLALAGLGACTRQPAEQIMPYVRAPEELVPGEPLFFATALPLGGAALGVLVESHMGRPTKVEGNPEHPASLGATDVFAQASVLGLYDPDRAQVVTSAGEIRTWSAFVDALRPVLAAERARRGAGLRILTETVTSPTLAQQIHDVLTAFPDARWHQYEPAARDGARAGARLAFGEDVDTLYRFDQADVILALDADFLACGPASVRYTREFSRKRRVDEAPGTMSRLYVVESTPTITGSKADHRLAVAADAVGDVARAVAVALRMRVRSPANVAADADWIQALVRDLGQHRGASIVLAGDQQPPAVHALAHAMNAALGNVGRTVFHIDPIDAEPALHFDSLRALTDDMEAGKVQVLLIVGGNPVLTAPADLRFADRLARVDLRVHLGLYDDETSLLCHWHIPEAHPLEAWSDTRAYDGTVTIMQPLIAPLYEGKSAHELLAACGDEPNRSPYDIVRGYWRRRYEMLAGGGAQRGTGAAGTAALGSETAGAEFERFWRRAVHDGVVAGSAAPPRRVSLRSDWTTVAAKTWAAADQERATGLEIVFRTDPTIYDGRFANNGWLQELPKPLTKLTWDNVALLAPATAERLGVTNGDLVDLTYRQRSVRAPVWIAPGQATDSVTVHLGYGRARGGRIATGLGFDAYTLRTSDAPWNGRGLEVHALGTRYRLACTQDHGSMEGRGIIRAGTLAEYRDDPAFARQEADEMPRDLTLYPNHPYEGRAWGMAIDLSACTGCSACVVACQAENNIAVVGKDQVVRGREMHWIRIDRYYTGALDAPRVHHQPVPCMHCENAPCELVCPVNATVHSSEGLNDMVYNRCVGTKYCSNNCPYKVRRFNFYLYSDWTTESLKMVHNPDVTVRSRGVMEKCSYCVQRINAGRIAADKENRPIGDGEVVPACAQACPAEAIVFGDQNDPTSRVAALKAKARNYALLGELNTRPRTTYLAAVRNPNPDLEGT